jgi:hypothetical protein
VDLIDRVSISVTCAYNNLMDGTEDVAGAARRLSLSESQVRRLAASGRIIGARKRKGVWAIPCGAIPKGRMHMGRPPSWA